MNFDYHEKLLFLFNHADRYICKLTAGFVLPALEKRTNHTVVINLQILLLYYIFSFCSSSLLVICYDYISHAILLEMGIVKSSCCCCCCCFFGKCASYDSFNRVVVISLDFSIYNPLLTQIVLQVRIPSQCDLFVLLLHITRVNRIQALHFRYHYTLIPFDDLIP